MFQFSHEGKMEQAGEAMKKGILEPSNMSQNIWSMAFISQKARLWLKCEYFNALVKHILFLLFYKLNTFYAHVHTCKLSESIAIATLSIFLQ